MYFIVCNYCMHLVRCRYYWPFKAQLLKLLDFDIQAEPAVFNFWNSGTLALSPERQSARMSEIKNGRFGLYATEHSKCNHMIALGSKGLSIRFIWRHSEFMAENHRNCMSNPKSIFKNHVQPSAQKVFPAVYLKIKKYIVHMKLCTPHQKQMNCQSNCWQHN